MEKNNLVELDVSQMSWNGPHKIAYSRKDVNYIAFDELISSDLVNCKGMLLDLKL